MSYGSLWRRLRGAWFLVWPSAIAVLLVLYGFLLVLPYRSRVRTGTNNPRQSAQDTQLRQQPKLQQWVSPPATDQRSAQGQASRESSADRVMPKTTAEVAAGAGRYDIGGIKLGIPLKDAIMALKAHNPNLLLTPESIQYDFLPYPLTYGISALPPDFKRPGAFHYSIGTNLPTIEAFYLALTMPPNDVVTWKISRLTTFDRKIAPSCDAVASDLTKKYGTPTWDDGPVSLSAVGSRDMFWVDDADGNRLPRAAVHQCAALATFKIAFAHEARSLTSYLSSTSLQMDPLQVRMRIDQGYFNNAEWRSEQCASYSIIQARLFDTRSIGMANPGLMAGLLVTMASGPLDHFATDETHANLVRARRERDAKVTNATKQNNGPKP